MVRQFNSRNGPVKVKCVYLCINGCCHLRNTLLVKLCTSWDEGATAGNSLEIRFPEYVALTFSCWVEFQKGLQIFVPSGHFSISSPIMTQSNISALRKRPDEMVSRRCFWSCVKIRGTIFAENFLIPKISFKICHTVSLFIVSSSAITLTPTLRSERTKVRTLSTLASVLCIFGFPLLESPCTFSRPFLNGPCHSKTLDIFTAYSP